MEEGSLTKEEEELTSSGGDGDEFPPSTCSIHCYQGSSKLGPNSTLFDYKCQMNLVDKYIVDGTYLSAKQQLQSLKCLTVLFMLEDKQIV